MSAVLIWFLLNTFLQFNWMRKMLTFTLSHYLHVLINWAATAMGANSSKIYTYFLKVDTSWSTSMRIRTRTLKNINKFLYYLYQASFWKISVFSYQRIYYLRWWYKVLVNMVHGCDYTYTKLIQSLYKCLVKITNW